MAAPLAFFARMWKFVVILNLLLSVRLIAVYLSWNENNSAFALLKNWSPLLL